MNPSPRLLVPTLVLTAALITGCKKPGTAAPSPQSAVPEDAVSPLHEALAQRLARRDTDYDGRTDVEENAEETDPQDPTSRRQTRLGLWRFDDDHFSGEAGEAPLRQVGAIQVEGAGTALRLNPKDTSATLAYRTQERDGKSNINLREGTIEFQFRPQWESGVGPGNLGTLIAVGVWRQDAAYPFWGLVVDAKGEQLAFRSNVDGQKHLLLETPIAFSKGQWVGIRLTYNPHVALLHINGEEVARQALGGVPRIPPMDVIQSDGFDIGANRYGGHPAHGDFDELATYNYMVEPTLGNAYRESTLGADVLEDPLRIALSAPLPPGTALTLRKRRLPTGDWRTVAKPFRGGRWIDHDMAPNARYHYQARNGQNNVVREATVAAHLQEPSDRGLLAIVSAASLPKKLDPTLRSFQRMRIAEGWRTRRFEIERHQPHSLERNHAAIQELQSAINAWRQSEGDGALSIFLVGRTPIIRSGSLNPDGHGARPFPVDGLYGDLLGAQSWRDEDGNGALDPSHWPGPLEASVGRLDFTDLKLGGAAGRLAAYERYFQKRTAFDRQTWRLENRVLAFPTFGYPALNQRRASEALSLAAALFGDDLARAHYRPFTEMGALIAHTSGYGAANRITLGSQSNLFLSEQFRNTDQAQPIGLHLMDGSYFGDWSQTDNLLRASLLPARSGLAAVWNRWGGLHFESMALGTPLGEALRTAVNLALEQSPQHRIPGTPVTVIGDPSLRFFTPPAPDNVTLTSHGVGARIQWPPLDGRLLIERSDTGIKGTFASMADLEASLGRWTDTTPTGPQTRYRVRLRIPTRSGRGTVLRWSHGVLLTPNAS